MPETIAKENETSLRLLDAIHAQYADFCQKVRFLVMGAFSMEDESLALEIISEFLDRKELELRKLEAAARTRLEDREGDSVSVERLLGRLLMEREDYRILLRIAEIRRKGGPRWEMLQNIIREPTVETHPPRE